MNNIIETAIANSKLSTLVTAIKKANLVETLSGPGPFTIFAPTNEAFAKIPTSTLEGILDDHDKLVSILTYHVISGKMMSKDITGVKEVRTMQGNTIKLDVGEVVKVNDIKVTMADIECSNGVIHTIDMVLMPK